MGNKEWNTEERRSKWNDRKERCDSTEWRLVDRREASHNRSVQAKVKECGVGAGYMSSTKQWGARSNGTGRRKGFVIETGT